eukprot:COSAG02_NODE_437_length_22340_cov_46.269952_12_plen_124_part_00
MSGGKFRVLCNHGWVSLIGKTGRLLEEIEADVREPEPERELAAEDVTPDLEPDLCLGGRTFTNSNFKHCYNKAKAPASYFKLAEKVTHVIREYCDRMEQLTLKFKSIRIRIATIAGHVPAQRS